MAHLVARQRSMRQRRTTPCASAATARLDNAGAASVVRRDAFPARQMLRAAARPDAHEKFVDEAFIATSRCRRDGGGAHSSFRREEVHPAAVVAPDGGGGCTWQSSIYARSRRKHQHLIDYPVRQIHRRTEGEATAALAPSCCSKGSDDLRPPDDPVGTVITGAETGEGWRSGEAARDARWSPGGSAGGLGNIRFKSSVNRAPVQRTLGVKRAKSAAIQQTAVLADVGLLPLSRRRARSTLVRAVQLPPAEGCHDYPSRRWHPALAWFASTMAAALSLPIFPGLIRGCGRRPRQRTPVHCGARARWLIVQLDRHRPPFDANRCSPVAEAGRRSLETQRVRSGLARRQATLAGEQQRLTCWTKKEADARIEETPLRRLRWTRPWFCHQRHRQRQRTRAGALLHPAEHLAAFLPTTDPRMVPRLRHVFFEFSNPPAAIVVKVLYAGIQWRCGN